MAKIRINKVSKEFGVGLQTVCDFLASKGAALPGDNLNQQLDEHQYELLKQEFGADKALRNKAESMMQSRMKDKEKKPAAPKAEKPREEQMVETRVPDDMRPSIKVQGTIALDDKGNPKPEAKPEAPAAKAPAPTPEPKAQEPEQAEEPAPKAEEPAQPAQQPAAPKAEKPHKERPSVEERAAAIGSEEDGVFKLRPQQEITGPKVLGTIDLSSINANTRPKKRSKEERRR